MVFRLDRLLRGGRRLLDMDVSLEECIMRLHSALESPGVQVEGVVKQRTDADGPLTLIAFALRARRPRAIRRAERSSRRAAAHRERSRVNEAKAVAADAGAALAELIVARAAVVDKGVLLEPLFQQWRDAEAQTTAEAAEPDEQPMITPEALPLVQPAVQSATQPEELPVASTAAPPATARAAASEPVEISPISTASSIGEPQAAADHLRNRLDGRWAVLQGLRKSPELNGRLVKVRSQRPDGRFETVRPGSGRNLAVRPANLRVLLEEFNGRAAGDTMDFDDGEIEILGFDAQESYWACQKAHMYLWIAAYNFR